MSSLARALFPASETAPLRRLVLALAIAPATVALVLTTTACVLAVRAEPTRAGVIEVTVETASAMTLLCFGFTFTFGLLAVAAFWILEQRGAIAWTVGGVLAGAIAGLLFTGLVMGRVERPVMVGFAVAGMAIFVLIRALAGIQDDRPSA